MKVSARNQQLMLVLVCNIMMMIILIANVMNQELMNFMLTPVSQVVSAEYTD